MIPFAQLIGLLVLCILQGSVAMPPTVLAPWALALGRPGSCDTDISSARDVGVSVCDVTLPALA